MEELLTFFDQATLVISVKEVMILMAYLSTCILFGKNKMGLLGTYAFLLYWGFMANQSQMVSQMGNVQFGVYVYPALALLLVVIALVGFFRDDH